MTTLERKINPDIIMETGVIFNRVVISKSFKSGDEGIGITMTKLVEHLANKPDAIDALRSLRNVDT